MKPIKAKSLNATINSMQTISAIMQIVCSCIIIFFGLTLLFLMAVYDLVGNSCISYYTPWLFTTAVCGTGFAIVLIIISIKLLKSSDTSKAIKKYLTIIILNSIFILLWIATIVIENGRYLSLRSFVAYCWQLIPLIVIIILISVSLFLKKQEMKQQYKPEE